MDDAEIIDNEIHSVLKILDDPTGLDQEEIEYLKEYLKSLQGVSFEKFLLESDNDT